MMHFRRMHPQPHPEAAFRRVYNFGSELFSLFAIGKGLTFVSETFYVKYPSVITAPTDMPSAQPWQDRDGEWYWRKTLHVPV